MMTGDNAWDLTGVIPHMRAWRFLPDWDNGIADILLFLCGKVGVPVCPQCYVQGKRGLRSRRRHGVHLVSVLLTVSSATASGHVLQLLVLQLARMMQLPEIVLGFLRGKAKAVFLSQSRLIIRRLDPPCFLHQFGGNSFVVHSRFSFHRLPHGGCSPSHRGSEKLVKPRSSNHISGSSPWDGSGASSRPR